MKIEKKDLKKIVELNENSPYEDQPSVTLTSNIRLKKHQLAALYKCKQLEQKCIDVYADGYFERLENFNIQNRNKDNEDIYTEENELQIKSSIGLLADHTGAGKSYEVLALICSDEDPSTLNIEETSILCNRKIVIHQKLSSIKSLPTNLIIIPSPLVNQWSNYINLFLPKSMKSIFLFNKRQMGSLLSNGIERYNVIVMTAHFYKQFFDYMRDTPLYRNITFKRIFVDEVDSFTITQMFNASFYWYITASVTNLLYPTGNFSKNIRGFMNYGITRNDVISMNSRPDILDISPFVVRNSMEFINQSYNLPEIIVNNIMCATPRSINILLGIVPKHIIDCLNANDYESAFSYYGISQRTSEKDIIEIFLEKLKRSVDNIDREIEFHLNGGYEFDTPDERETYKKNKETLKNRHIQQMESIEERIKKTNECCICYTDIQNKTLLKCCSNPFCFKCINTWLVQSKRCPMCKSEVTKDSVFIVDENRDSRYLDKSSDVSVDTSSLIHQNNTKETNIMNIIKSLSPDSKILIFTKFSLSSNLKNWFHTNNIEWSEVIGGKNIVDRVILNYKQGNIKILLLNPISLGSGLNLENTSDIILIHKLEKDLEKQVIGRAQRYGRDVNKPLRLWKLTHENESEIGN